MPLIEDEPPSVRPRGHSMRRSPEPFSGSVVKFQFTSGLRNSERMPAGIWIIGCQSLGPASSRITDAPVSDNRAATVQPAEPAPTITNSACMRFSTCLLDPLGAYRRRVVFLGDHRT